MPVHFMYDESPSSGSRVTAPVESWPPGARVITTFGVGTVIGYNPETKIHEVFEFFKELCVVILIHIVGKIKLRNKLFAHHRNYWG